MPACLKWGEERHQECVKHEDQGYDECSRYEDQGRKACCGWVPCSWACRAWVWLANIVCVAWTWVSKIVCVAWTWITTAVCVLFDVATTVVGAIITTLEAFVGWALSAVAAIVEVLAMIPVVGWAISLATHFNATIWSLNDYVLGFLGIRPEKILRVCTVILRDAEGTAGTVADAVALLQKAADVFKHEANVRIIPLRPFYYTTGFRNEAERVDASWITEDPSTSASPLLHVPCNGPAYLADLWPVGQELRIKMTTLCFFGTFRRVIGYGAPVTCFIIRDVLKDDKGNDFVGCALWITDYVLVEGTSANQARTIAHELGHACNLWHVCVDLDYKNLMASNGSDVCPAVSNTQWDENDPQLNPGQVLRIRASKHVTYL